VGPKSDKEERMSQERTLGDVASRILLENDRVRIWEMNLAPGESSDVHEHTLDYILVQVAGDRIAGVPEPDTKGPYKDYIEADVVPGNVIYVEKGGIETAKNVGQQRYHEILIELK
jgi:beta-alanine degradation protein BauB